MKKVRCITLVLLLQSVFFCSAQHLSRVSFLEGTWKIENKDTYEKWIKVDNRFVGHSFKMVEGQKIILETLTISKIDGKITYHALVPDQNNGNAIPFTLNTGLKANILSFENPEHDFPKKIQYKKIDAAKIHVSVLGEDGKGFSYYIIKQ